MKQVMSTNYCHYRKTHNRSNSSRVLTMSVTVVGFDNPLGFRVELVYCKL